MISYTVQVHPRARNLKIKVLPSGEVVVVRPKFGFFGKSVEQFVREHEAWILQSIAKMKKHQRPKLTNEDEVLIFGKKYQKKIEFSTQEKVGVRVQGEHIIINPVSETTASVDRALQSFFKSTAEKYIVPRTLQLSKVMNISYGQITLRQQKTRWGSCSSTGNLNFNWRLVHTPPEVIDYVIIHELAHRKQMNHSAQFWDIVRKFDPEYLKHRGWLKRQGMALE